MRRLSIASRGGALAWAFPVAAQAQGRAIRPARRRRQGGGRGRLHGVPPDQPDHAQLRLHREGWRELIGTMVDLSGSPEEQAEIAQYLAAHFPPNTAGRPS